MEVIALRADYYDKFACLGSKCQLNCCNYNWSIYVDRTTFNKYKKFTSIGKKVNSDYTRKVKTSIELNPDSDSTSDYGKIIHIVDKKAFILGNDAYKSTEYICPFYGYDNLCELQSNFGEDMLCFTCKLFPRNLNFVFEDYEQSLTTKCEAVCELLYKSREPIKFNKHKINVNKHTPIIKSLTSDMKEYNAILKHFTIIRATCKKILQSREFDLDNRIILMGLFLSKVSSLKGESIQKTPNYAKSFLKSQHEYLEYFDIKVKNDTKPEKKKNYFYPHKILLEMMNFDEIELGYVEKSLLIRIKNNLVMYYNNYGMLRKKANKMLENDSHYIENVMVNLLISQIYPFNDAFDVSNSVRPKIDLMDNYIIFAWSYLSLKVMLTSAITLNDELDLNILYQATVMHSREAIGSTKMLTEICKILKNFGFSSVSQMALLIGET